MTTPCNIGEGQRHAPTPHQIVAVDNLVGPVEFERCHRPPAGTAACTWVLEACDEVRRLALPADLVDRSRAQARPRGVAAREGSARLVTAVCRAAVAASLSEIEIRPLYEMVDFASG